jgi:hypothetical protein
MNTAVTVSSITIVIMILLFSSYHPFSSNQAQGQFPECPNDYHHSPNGNCELDLDISGLPRCLNGTRRSPSGICESTSLTDFQNCPVGYQVSATGFCVPVASSQFVDSPGYPTTVVNPNTPQTTFAQPISSALTSSLVSPTLINPPAGQLSPWFPSLPAIACGGTSTMATIGSLEIDSNGDNNNGNSNNKNDDDDDDDDDDKKEYAFQIESDGGPNADPESVDGTVFAG